TEMLRDSDSKRVKRDLRNDTPFQLRHSSVMHFGCIIEHN
ncbi:hypothetical protein Tco_0415010, partial [Tanacetum coccineum]